MKRTVITLVGLSVLMFFTFVSCEDKLLDDSKGSEGNTEGSPYRTLQDSMFYYSDGKLQRANYAFYDSIGNYIKTLELRYDSEGNLIQNQEGTYDIYDYKNIYNYDYTIYWNNNGLSDDTKIELKCSGSENNYKSSRKEYIYYSGKWMLKFENEVQSNNNSRSDRSLSYGLYNGQIMVVSRIEYIAKIKSGKVSTDESSSYRKNYNYDGNNFFIRSISGESWTKNTTNYDGEGRFLKQITLESFDGISWYETSREEYKYDSQGNMIEYISKGGLAFIAYINETDNINRDYTNSSCKSCYKYNGNNKILREEYYVWSESDDDYILKRSTDYKYSASGILAAVEINSESNDIYFPKVLEDKYNGKVPTGGHFGGGTKCSITCDSNGYPASEVLYRLDSEGNLEEVGRCSLVYDSNGTNYSYVVEMLENDKWEKKLESQSKRTYDASGNELTSYFYSKEVYTSYTYYWGTNDIYSSTTYTLIYEGKSENRYNELGYISYSSSSSVSNTCYVSSDGREGKSSSESKQETYYTTIKVK